MNKFEEKYGNEEWESTGNPAVDCVAACEYFYRNKDRKVKTLILREDYYDLFQEFVYGKVKVEVGQEYQFNGIPVTKALIEINEPMQVEFDNE